VPGRTPTTTRPPSGSSRARACTVAVAVTFPADGDCACAAVCRTGPFPPAPSPAAIRTTASQPPQRLAQRNFEDVSAIFGPPTLTQIVESITHLNITYWQGREQLVCVPVGHQARVD